MEAQGWWQRLAEFANNLDTQEGHTGLRAAAAAFSRAGRDADAETCLRRLADAKVLDAAAAAGNDCGHSGMCRSVKHQPRLC